MAVGHTKALSSREKVLKAATALFAANGFHETSTRDVARKARVNEITIYRLFKNKQELYLQVLNGKLGVLLPEWLRPILESSDDSDKVFLSLAQHLEKLFDPVFLRLLFYAALEKPDLLRKCYRPRLLSFYEILGGHIQEQIDRGILRNLEPALMGRALVGTIAYHQIVCQLLGGRDFPGCGIEGSANTYADIWLRGALASGTRAVC
jgi:AcrR family transcriptional regulator